MKVLVFKSANGETELIELKDDLLTTLERLYSDMVISLTQIENKEYFVTTTFRVKLNPDYE